MAGSALISILRRIGRVDKTWKSRATETFEQILVIRPGGIGDAVLLLPALAEIRNYCPNAHIDILCEKRNQGVFHLSGDINRIYLYDSGWGLLKCLRNSYDAVIDTEQWHRLSAIIAYLTGAHMRVGFNTNERGELFTHQVPYGHDDYEGLSFFNLIAPVVGITPPPWRCARCVSLRGGLY